MKEFLTIFLMLLGMSSVWGQRSSTYTGWDCNGRKSNISADSKGMSDCLDDWKNTMGYELTDQKAQRLQAGMYPVNGKLEYFSADTLRLLGYCDYRLLKLGKLEEVSPGAQCVMNILPTITSKVQYQSKTPQIDCLKLGRFSREEGKVLFTACNQVFVYSFDEKECHCTEVVTERLEICEGSYTLWRGQQLKVSGTYRDSTEAAQFVGGACDTLWILNLDVTPLPQRELIETKTQGDSIQFGEEWKSTTGRYERRIANTSNSGCDTIEVLFLTVIPPPCEPCKTARLDWLHWSWLIAELYSGAEWLPLPWQRRILLGGALRFERKFKDGLLFKKHLCIGESFRLGLLIRSANTPEIKPEGCINCHNLISADRRLLELDLLYRVHYLKGSRPFTVSAGIGPVMRYQRVEGQQSVMFGGRVNLEAELFLSKKFSLFGTSQLDYYRQHKFVASMWLGLRYRPIWGTR